MRVLGRKVVEREQLVSIIDQAFAGLWVFRLERVDEQIEGGMRILAGLGLPYVVQHFPSFGLGALGKVIEHIAGLMHPAALLAGCRENVFQRRPEAHGTIAQSQFWSLQAPAFEAEKYLAPALGAFPDAVFNGLKVLLSGATIDQRTDDRAMGTAGSESALLLAHRVDITLSDGRRVVVEGPTALSSVVGLVQGLMA